MKNNFFLPPDDFKIDFQIEMKIGYMLDVPEGSYLSPVFSIVLPIFKGMK
jgi:hypothetical protein